MTIDIVANKILQIKEIICGILDERSFYLSEEELYEDGNEEEIINRNLDDIQELYIFTIQKVDEKE